PDAATCGWRLESLPMSDNPLLNTSGRIAFDEIDCTHYAPAVRSTLDDARAELEALKTYDGPPSYETVVGRLEALREWPGRVFGLVRHLNDVMNSTESREAYNAVLPEYTSFMAGLTTDLELWRVLKRFAGSQTAERLDPLRRRHLDKLVEEFKRAGADLPDDQRARAQQLKVELAQLSTKFAENVLDSTNAYELI